MSQQRSVATTALVCLCVGLALILVGCSGGGSIAAAPSGGSPPGQPAPASTPQSSGNSGAPTKVDLNSLFPPGPGRELVLQNCTNCHSIVPIVMSQHDANGWQTHRLNHESRVAGLSAAEKDQVWDYLIKSFPPGRPLPELPPELLKGEAGY